MEFKSNKMTNYNESKEMHLRYPSTNNQKYFTPEQAKKMGYFRPEYVDVSKPYEEWFNAKGQRIYVQRIDPLSDLRKNTGKSGFRMHESKTNKNVVKISENTLKKIVAESVKKVLKETELDYDMDNFSGRWNRGPRYNIYIGDTLMYSDVPEETADRVWDEVCRKAEMWGEEPRCEEI